MSRLDNGGKSGIRRCFQDHKPLKIEDYQIQGGSCVYPPEGLDIYIGLDSDMKMHEESYPWIGKVVAVRYLIPDTQAPEDAASFDAMIAWIVASLKQGKKIHVGCVGGHGRTGVVLTALVYVMTGNKDAITYVRENYCHKAVESVTQIEFLSQHYGINKVEKPTLTLL